MCESEYIRGHEGENGRSVRRDSEITEGLVLPCSAF